MHRGDDCDDARTQWFQPVADGSSVNPNIPNPFTGEVTITLEQYWV